MTSRNPQLQSPVAHLSDAEIDRLRRGGHDPAKIHAAFAEAAACVANYRDGAVAWARAVILATRHDGVFALSP
jgi:pyruvate dehydrogenase complex dehydrogenase (E1) component